MAGMQERLQNGNEAACRERPFYSGKKVELECQRGEMKEE